MKKYALLLGLFVLLEAHAVPTACHMLTAAQAALVSKPAVKAFKIAGLAAGAVFAIFQAYVASHYESEYAQGITCVNKRKLAEIDTLQNRIAMGLNALNKKMQNGLILEDEYKKAKELLEAEMCRVRHAIENDASGDVRAYTSGARFMRYCCFLSGMTAFGCIAWIGKILLDK